MKIISRKITALALFLLCICTAGKAQSLPGLSAHLTGLNPVNIFPSNAAESIEIKDKFKTTQPSKIAVQSVADASPLITAEVLTSSKNHYDVQASWKSTAPVKKGDVLLARFAIRSVYAKQESGEAVVYFFMQGSAPPFEKSVIVDLSVGPEWKTVNVPFTALHEMKEGEAAICFSFGALPQKVEIASVQVLNFEDKATVAQLPVTRFTYAGREPGAAWRTQALQHIETLRTAPLNVRVVDRAGRPLKDVTVKASLLQPDFIWGTAVNEALLAKDLPDAGSYRKILKEFFNSAVIENGFKAGAWSQTARREETLKVFDWLQGQGFRIRGHNLVWPAWKFNASLYKTTAQTDTAAFRKLIGADIKERMAITKGKVIAWDVINEMMHEKEFFACLPKDEAAQWFKLAKSLDPKAQLFLNEYGMLNGLASPDNIREYIGIADGLRKAGAPVEALGVQGHIGRQPRSPAQVLKDLDLFGPTGLPVQITEFDINMTDEELQADYTRDFLIACYSHPSVTGFTMWGFWQGAHWKPDAAMFRKDWSEKPNAAVWREWVLGKWKTKAEARSDERGEVATRGHLGKYEITVTKGANVVKKSYQLTKDSSPLTITIE